MAAKDRFKSKNHDSVIKKSQDYRVTAVQAIPLIALHNIHKRYLGKEPIFSSINLVVLRGEFVFLTGVSGAGKSTLLRMLMGLEKPDRGSVIFNGTNVMALSGEAMCRHRRSIGMVYQDYKLLQNRSAADNIAMPLHINGCKRGIRDSRVKDIAQKLNITKLLRQTVQSLSGGEQQLVAIARAAVHNPMLVLADEPTANLDQKMASRIFEMLNLLNEEGTTVIFSTHDINLLKSHKKRIVLLKQSDLVEVH